MAKRHESKKHRTVSGQSTLDHERTYPIFTQGPVELRQQDPGPQVPPAGWPGTGIEWMVYQSLERAGKRSGLDFQYQSPLMGGQSSLGGAVVDFIVNDPPIAIDVQGNYWHYGQGVERETLDRAQRSDIEALGYTVVWIDEPDVLADSDFYVTEALAGHDHSHGTKGF